MGCGALRFRRLSRRRGGRCELDEGAQRRARRAGYAVSGRSKQSARLDGRQISFFLYHRGVCVILGGAMLRQLERFVASMHPTPRSSRRQPQMIQSMPCNATSRRGHCEAKACPNAASSGTQHVAWHGMAWAAWHCAGQGNDARVGAASPKRRPEQSLITRRSTVPEHPPRLCIQYTYR